MHAPIPLAPVRGLATAANVLIGVVCIADLYRTWTAWNAYFVVADYSADRSGRDGDDLIASDNAVQAASSALWLTSVAAAAVFLTWLWRARVNSERLSPVMHRMPRGWTIGAWFCPIVNLWFPRRIVDDVWRASRPGVPADQRLIEPLPLSPLVRVWWFALISSYIVLFLGGLSFPSWDAVVVDYFETVAVYSTFSTLLVITAGVLLIKVVRQITEWQSTPRVTPDGFTRQRAPLS
ncbi:MAG TPA: DUF4328 domain-containing protein [Microlunatus sp.]|nr:DUF4328 domain-containing protein [Microlunatus sp.]